MNKETANDPRSALREGERLVARVWRLLALRGVLAIVFSVVLLVWPDIGLRAMVTVVGVFAIASGFVSGVAAFALPLSGTRTVLLAVSGLVLAAFGVVMFVEPGDGAIALLALVAAFALVRGTFDVALAVELRRVLGELKKRMPSPVQPKPVAHG